MKSNTLKRFLLSLSAITLLACQTPGSQSTQSKSEDGVSSTNKQADHLLTVDCLLPGQIRKLGAGATYVTPRRPIKTSASSCEIRAGEYVAFDRANFATALKIWLPLAQGGDPAAQTYVGEIYEKGLGVPPDHFAAAEWYRRAAKQDHSRARINLGYLYEKGLGVEKDLTKAINLYRQASGIESDDLQFASVLQASHESEIEQAVSTLKTQLEQQKRKVLDLRSKIKKLEATLVSHQQDVDKARVAMAEAKIKLLTAQQKQGNGNVDPKKLNALRSKLSQKERLFADQEKKLAVIQGKMDQQNIQMNAALVSAKQKNSALQNKIRIKDQEVDNVKNQLAKVSSELSESREAVQNTKVKLSAKVEQIYSDREQILLERKSLASNFDGQLDDMVRQLEVSQKALLSKEAEVSSLQDENQGLRLSSGAKQSQNNSQMLGMKRNLDVANKELLQLKSTISGQQQEFNRQKEQMVASMQDQQDEETKAAMQLRDRKINDLNSRLVQREQEAEFEREHMRKLVSKMTEQADKVKTLKSTDLLKLASAGPIIEIIDPPIFITRSLPSIRLPSSARQREVLGKVSASSGLAGFYINDVKHPIEGEGIFRFSARLTEQEFEKPYQVVAVDTLGQRTQYQFNLIKDGEGAVQRSSKEIIQSNSNDFGAYYALLIGNTEYEHWSDLVTPKQDVTVIAKLLEEQYGFTVEVLTDATRYEILTAIHTYKDKMSENDNLLIYYAGHGDLDKVNKRGHWIPVDGEAGNPSQWIKNVDITDMINTIPAKDILVVADSCYSGTLTGSSISRVDRQISPDKMSQYLRLLSQARSRVVLSSGGEVPVLDGTPGSKHSVFAQSFIDALERLKEPVAGYRLFIDVATDVSKKAQQLNFPQEPRYAPIRHAGHESGDFIFVPKG
ncbi:MAG: hypothetical protein COB04_17910 [Gammaproteobacteria bacterium]|nr:MAG: hypothetical protein COB04_17910 [Gammaproteobacteria bacterium]